MLLIYLYVSTCKTYILIRRTQYVQNINNIYFNKVVLYIFHRTSPISKTERSTDFWEKHFGLFLIIKTSCGLTSAGVPQTKIIQLNQVFTYLHILITFKNLKTILWFSS